ncbi:MAG TPA: LysM peptidoglycan-binding domain-containing protein [Solirubrobacterales bacterium]|nr:LysM peptidoglycan-binding domain-containing protein [Solirubrobacterales bacterium]
MNRTKRYLARLFAVLAIAAVVVAVILIVNNFKREDSKDETNGNGKAHPAKQQQQQQQQKKPRRTKAKTYTVESGDTLTAIAHKTGVPVAELQALNPEIDPQILIAGEVLKLR